VRLPHPFAPTVTTRPTRPSLLLFGAASLALHVAVAAAAVGVAARRSSATFRPAAETLTGETLDLEQEIAAAENEPPPVVPVEDLPAAHAPETPGPAPAAAHAPAPSRASVSASASASESAVVAPSPPPLPYGAVGVRYATDLATTFTRSFPQAASGDPAWGQAPFGAAGSATVSLVIDETGRLTSTAVEGAPSAALRRGIERTLVLLRPRELTAVGPLTRLRITARVGHDDVHDGLHGEVFALSGGSFAGEVGSAFFALPAGAGPGRRVDVEVRLLP
jgi:hypothetical protein